jgi:hypothetical protein
MKQSTFQNSRSNQMLQMPKGGTPPLVPMWPQPHVRVENMNPYPFFPFNPQWGENLTAAEFETFCALLRLAWASPRPCFLPADQDEIRQMLAPYFSEAPLPSEPVMSHFLSHCNTGLLYFPPQLKALERLVEGENIYSLLWDNV